MNIGKSEETQKTVETILGYVQTAVDTKDKIVGFVSNASLVVDKAMDSLEVKETLVDVPKMARAEKAISGIIKGLAGVVFLPVWLFSQTITAIAGGYFAATSKSEKDIGASVKLMTAPTAFAVGLFKSAWNDIKEARSGVTVHPEKLQVKFETMIAGMNALSSPIEADNKNIEKLYHGVMGILKGYTGTAALLGAVSLWWATIPIGIIGLSSAAFSHKEGKDTSHALGFAASPITVAASLIKSGFDDLRKIDV
jgi:hypothetical protein